MKGVSPISPVTCQRKICQLKLVLLGESAVGKSSLALNFVNEGHFNEFHEHTIGAAFLTRAVCFSSATVQLNIWDTAGQERYHAITPMYYRSAKAAVVVYDITNYGSFVKAQEWVKELRNQAVANILIVLAGNKADLSAKREVEHNEAASYATLNGLLFMETSAKTALNVNEIFLTIAKKLTKTETGSGCGSSNTIDVAGRSGSAIFKVGCCK